MPKYKLQCATSSNRLAFHTPSGFSLNQGICLLKTSRGNLRPSLIPSQRKEAFHELHVRRLSENAVEFWQSIRNLQPQLLKINAIQMFNGRLELAGSGWRVAHSELFKCDRVFDGYGYLTNGLFAPLPGTEGDFGTSEDWPFPGMFFTHPERGTVLMAVLSQERCKPAWSLRRRGAANLLRASDVFWGVPSIGVNGREEFCSERWVVLAVGGGIEDAVAEYYRILRQRIAFYGTNSVLRRAVVWGTWNYNSRPRSYCDITHKMVAANARALRRLVPDKPRVVMIDDGYQRNLSRFKDMKDWFASSLEIFYDDGTPPHDPRLFPRGMKAVADDIKKAGCLPAIWATPRIRRDCPLAKAHPEWILQLEGGRQFGPRSAYLDYSLPEVRAYTRQAWRTIFQEWGFQGIKLDFWSLPFEVPQVRYRNRDMTAVQLRNLLLGDLREFVPENGFMLIAVVCNGGGNPFPGRFADGTRMGSDIGDGSFNEVRQSAVCLTVASPLFRHDCYLGDSDSIGWCPKNTPGQNRLWATMAFLSGAICEIGGDLTAMSADQRRLLKTVAGSFGPARRTLNGIASGGINSLPADHLFLERDDAVYEGYLNWMPWRREISLARPARDLWTGKIIRGKYKIPPHDAVLFKR